MDRIDYIRDENWDGSYYELAIELAPTGNDIFANGALRSLWSQPELRGPWRERADFDSTPDGSAITIEVPRLYGCFRLDDDSEIGCISYFIREENGSDWLDFSIPTGMLERRFPISYPLDMATNPWMVEFDERLAKIGAAIYDTAPFRLGLIGEEVSGATSIAELRVQDCEQGGVLVPLPVWNTLAPRREPTLLAKGKLAYVAFQGPHITYGA